jgi:hypothetical protein
MAAIIWIRHRGNLREIARIAAERKSASGNRPRARELFPLAAAGDAQQLHLLVQVRALDVERLGGLRHVPAVLAEALQDERALDRVAEAP